MAKMPENIVVDVVVDAKKEAQDHVDFFNEVAGETRFCSFDKNCYPR
jgi:hypothetical protein